MSVPEQLLKKCHVFCYSSDLVDASDKLAEYLGCKVSKVYDGDFDSEADTATVAWLVGHGSKTNTRVGNLDGSFYYTIRNICDWLLDTRYRDYSYLVDTCCYPNRRKSSQTFGSSYYCTNDNECVTVITSYDSLNEWWDDNNMHQYE